jgi:hypothetical protein
VLQFGPHLRRPEGRRKLLQLITHEYLHQWNVRRLRPAELVPIEYGNAVVVPTLWFAEGVTSYLDQLLQQYVSKCFLCDVLRSVTYCSYKQTKDEKRDKLFFKKREE